MRPDTSSRTEALQNSLVRRHGVGKGFCWSSGKVPCDTGTKACMTEKGSPTRVQRYGAWLKQVSLPLPKLCFISHVPLFMLRGWGRKWCPQFLCSQRGVSVHIASQGSILRTANNFLPVRPRSFSDHCFHKVRLWVVYLPSFQKQRSGLYLGSTPANPDF